MSHGADKLSRNILFICILAGVIFFIAILYETQRDTVLGFINGTLAKKEVQATATYYTVMRVVDGDTLAIDYNGVDEKVRLIGINTPETVDQRKTVECFGKEASTRMKELALDSIIRLERDPTQDARDIYGRILAYVYLEDGQMLNRKMIAEGYAYEYTYMTPYIYQKEFKSLQALAKTSGRGLWSTETCSGKK